MPDPMPAIEPSRPNTSQPNSHPTGRWKKELVMSIGMLSIIVRSKSAKFTINTFDGVRKLLALKQGSIFEYYSILFYMWNNIMANSELPNTSVKSSSKSRYYLRKKQVNNEKVADDGHEHKHGVDGSKHEVGAHCRSFKLFPVRVDQPGVFWRNVPT